MFTTRYPWGSAAVLLCALLLQDCQSSSLRIIEREELALGAYSGTLTRHDDRTSGSSHTAASSPVAGATFMSSDTSTRVGANGGREDLVEGAQELPAEAAPKEMVIDTLPHSGQAVPNLSEAYEGVAFALFDCFDCNCAVPESLAEEAAEEMAIEEMLARTDYYGQVAPELPEAAPEPENMKLTELLSGQVLDVAFGEVEWEHYFGKVGSAPSLPSNIDTVLGSACPFWPDKKVKDTHLLVLMPKIVDGAPFTLNLLEELIQRPKHGGHRAEYEYYSDDVKAQFGTASPDRSYWLLMTRDVLEGSRSESYSDQKALVESYASRTGYSYELPRALETATTILMHYARTGERLLSDDPWTYTRCQELVDGRYPVVVGGFGASGLRVDDGIDYGLNFDGVVGCRKF